MARTKDLPAVDFHAVVARRDPALAERLMREGLSTSAVDDSGVPALSIVPMHVEVQEPMEMPKTTVEADANVGRESSRRSLPKVTTKPNRRRRGVVQRASGEEAGRICVYVPSDLALRLRKFCFENDRTITDVAGELLVDALEKSLRGTS